MKSLAPSNNEAIKIADTLFPALCKEVVVSPLLLKMEVKHGHASSSVTVSPEPVEAGNLIGKGGKTIKSFEVLAKLIGDKYRWPIVYGIDVGLGPNPPQHDRGNIGVKEWDLNIVSGLLNSTLSAFLQQPAEVEVLINTRRRTSYEVVLDDDEPLAKVDDDEISEALNTIFNAIGRLHGKVINIVYVRKNTPSLPQPLKADGRNAKEIES